MKKSNGYFWLSIFTVHLSLTALSPNSMAEKKEPTPTSNNESSTKKLLKPSTKKHHFKVIEWVELIPKQDLEALNNPPSYITDIEDGTLEDTIGNQLQSTNKPVKDDPYQQALVSTNIIPTLNNQAIRIPGFIVPLEHDDNQVVTQFFLVPFFGACIHVPPPPPNQIIFINHPKGLKLEDMNTPFWISGILKTSLIENEVATSAYSMKMQSYEEYKE